MADIPWIPELRFPIFWLILPFFHSACDPPDLAEESKPSPAQKVKKESRESLWGSLRGSWPTRQNESKTSLWSQKTGDFWLAESPGDSFLTRFGGSARTLGDSPRDSPGDSFSTFWAGEGFDSSARSGGSQHSASLPISCRSSVSRICFFFLKVSLGTLLNLGCVFETSWKFIIWLDQEKLNNFLFFFDRVKIWCITKKVVYKLHAAWFANRTPGEFRICSLFQI